MASERRIKLQLAASTAAMVLLGAAAGALAASPRLSILCVLAALVFGGLFWRKLKRLSLRQPFREQAPEAPSPPQQAVMNNAIAVEARLEHAPVAIFQIENGAGAGEVSARNGNARRLLAPGRASDAAQLMRQLQEQAVGRRTLTAFNTERGIERALVAVSALSLHGKQHRLVALIPVESELEEEALNAWRELVHVLTHEIMNSLTPVASLSHTAYELLDELRAELPPEASKDLGTALDAISRRADSLVQFVHSYRSLSNVPQPHPEATRLQDLFARIAALVGPAWQARAGRAVFSTEPTSLELMVDPGQLEQALINLIKNAADATAGTATPEVQISARYTRGGRLKIDVSDNGSDIADDAVPHIFTPFFSTKEQGVGIGLALVRQLIHANGGTVRYAKSVSPGACFVITF